MRVVLISTYDLGRQPFGLASPAAWLRAAGHDVRCVDVTRSRLTDDDLADAGLVAFFLPMHTATRLALPVINQVRLDVPGAHLCAYGLYAPLAADTLRAQGIHTILGPEFEQDLAALADALRQKAQAASVMRESGAALPRLTFIQPDRSDLPSLRKYASLQTAGGRKTVGYTEASRGCKHLCRHCPIVPVYEGRFRIVSVDVVMADVRAQVAAGAQHMTFGDPDFFNGPRHALNVIEALAREHPGTTYDVTIKVEHLRANEDLLPRLLETGCAFVTSAVESLDDEVLRKLEKGHTRRDFEEVVEACRRVGLPLSPTFVAFTPWTTLEGYCELLREVDRLGLVAAVAPIQYAIRLLIPQGSRMLELEDVRARVTHFDPRSLVYVWRHVDVRVDALQRQIETTLGSRLNVPREEFFARVWRLAHDAAGIAAPARTPLAARATVPYLNEPWYC